jgi:Family of unknown function (DUF5681)
MTADNSSGGTTSYEVGFGKPPQAARFRKGTSGNKRGRPKGSKNVAALLSQALSEHVTVTRNGTTQRISKFELALWQLVDRGANGDLRALGMLLQRIDAAYYQQNEPSHGLDAADEEVAKALIERIRKSPQEAADRDGVTE